VVYPASTHRLTRGELRDAYCQPLKSETRIDGEIAGRSVRLVEECRVAAENMGIKVALAR